MIWMDEIIYSFFLGGIAWFILYVLGGCTKWGNYFLKFFLYDNSLMYLEGKTMADPCVEMFYHTLHLG